MFRLVHHAARNTVEVCKLQTSATDATAAEDC